MKKSYKKQSPTVGGTSYMDGLVSTGIEFPSQY